MIRVFSLAGLVLVVASATAQGQQPAAATRAQPAATPTKAAVNDSLFTSAALSAGLAEVILAELGIQRATDPELKKFSQQMLDTHTHMNQQLVELAARRRIPVPRTTDARAQFCAQSLAGLSGEEFDRCFAHAQFGGHREAVAMFQAEADRGQDPEIKAWAAKSLSHIKEHLKTIKPIAKRYETEKEKEEGASPTREK
jgi:putative membrane protein